MTNKELFKTICQMNEGFGLKITNYVEWKDLTLVQKMIVCIMQPLVYVIVPIVIILAILLAFGEITASVLRPHKNSKFAKKYGSNK